MVRSRAARVTAALGLLALGGVASVVAGCRSAPRAAVAVQQADYAAARRGFHTNLVEHVPSPQAGDPVAPAPDADEVEYASGPLHLRAWISRGPSLGAKRPAVLFLHGGFAFGADDWEMSRPYRDAGFVVMTPLLRGENGQPGDFTVFYDEVDDVIAAAEYLRQRPEVDAAHVYVAGHSAGGTLTMLAAEDWSGFRAAASFSGSPDQAAFCRSYLNGRVPFDSRDPREYEMRSPLTYAGSFKCPARLYCGSEEAAYAATTQATAEIARQRKLDVEAIVVPGDHFTAVPEEIRQSIAFFRSR